VAKGIQVVADCRDAGTVMVDPERLRQIVWNLLTNAVKFTASGGHVRVVVRRQGNEIELRVDDDGAGIEAAFLPHIFDHFTQADPGVRRKHGLGLGLAITRYLVEAHGGSIRASSAGSDRGSEFMVRLPLTKIAERRPSEEPPPLAFAPGSLGGRRVLLIEDDTQSRVALGMLLREAGAVVDEFPAAEPAFDAFQKQRPDLILSDLSLPQEDGCSLLRRIRAAETEAKHKPVPAIALTGMARAQDQHQALLSGFQRHVSKPITPEQLFDAITEVMRRRG